MKTFQTKTLGITIKVPPTNLLDYLDNPFEYPKWGTKFFTGPVVEQPNKDLIVDIKMMGGATKFAVSTNKGSGAVQLYFAKPGKEFKEPLEIRVIPNGEGSDLLWTLVRAPKLNLVKWKVGLFFMSLELKALRKILEEAGTTP